MCVSGQLWNMDMHAGGDGLQQAMQWMPGGDARLDVAARSIAKRNQTKPTRFGERPLTARMMFASRIMVVTEPRAHDHSDSFCARSPARLSVSRPIWWAHTTWSAAKYSAISTSFTCVCVWGGGEGGGVKGGGVGGEVTHVVWVAVGGEAEGEYVKQNW